MSLRNFRDPLVHQRTHAKLTDLQASGCKPDGSGADSGETPGVFACMKGALSGNLGRTGFQDLRMVTFSHLMLQLRLITRYLEIQYGWMKEHPDVALIGHRIVQIDESAAPPPLPDDCRADRISRWGRASPSVSRRHRS